MRHQVRTTAADGGPIRVLQVVTWMDVGGAQEHVLALASGLGAAGVQVAVAVGSSRGSRGGLLDRLASTVRTEQLRHLRREISPLHDVLAVAELGRLIDRFRPHVVHTHSSKAGVVGRLAAVHRPVVTVHNVHGWSFNPVRRTGARRAVAGLERGLASRTDALLLVSDADLASARRYGIVARRRTEVVRTGIDLAGFRAAGRGRAGRPAGTAPTVGTVGRLTAAKDPVTAVRAFAELSRRCPGATFRWIGDGPLRDQVADEARRLGVSESFQLLGNRGDVGAQLAGLDVFVLASRFEGLPRSVIEAMAAHTPVVATRVGGIPDVVTDGVTGRLVPPGDPGALAAAVADLLEDPAAAAGMAGRAAGVVEEFSEERLCERTLAVYRDLLA